MRRTISVLVLMAIFGIAGGLIGCGEGSDRHVSPDQGTYFNEGIGIDLDFGSADNSTDGTFEFKEFFDDEPGLGDDTTIDLRTGITTDEGNVDLFRRKVEGEWVETETPLP